MAKKKKTATKSQKSQAEKAGFKFEPGTDYRIHFRNGHSGEYHGAALVHGLPFSALEVVKVDVIPRAEEE